MRMLDFCGEVARRKKVFNGLVVAFFFYKKMKLFCVVIVLVVYLHRKSESVGLMKML